MKKFSKILTLLLSLVLIVTAFTVITLAAEKPEAPSFSGTNNASSIDFTFDSQTVGAIRAYGSTKRGVIFYDATVDGNKYLSAEYVYNDSETTKTGQTTDIYSTSDYSTYSLNNYPVMSFDFDVMSELGILPTNKTSCATYFSFFVSKNGTKGPSFDRIEFANLGLAKKDPYVWRHLTFVFEYDPTDYLDGEETKHYDFKIYFYENGEKLDYEMQADFSSNATWTAYSGDYSKVLIDCFRLNCERFPGAAYSANFGFDNFSFNYFPKGEDGSCAYTIDEIGAYVYDEDYQLPKTSAPAAAVRTDAEGNEYFYATGEEAFEAAVDGDTITLLDDVDSVITVDKAITVKTALAKTDGTLVKYKSFNFVYATKDGYVATPDETVSSILTFAKSEDYYTVNWDPACEGECTCPAGKHFLTETTTVALGENPIYTEKNIVIDPEGRIVVEFLGWSQTKNDVPENALDLSAVTSNTAGDTINLYPIYKIDYYDFLILDAEGAPSYYLASEFITKIGEAEADSTVKLLTDIELSETIAVSKNLTIDIDGHDIKKTSYHGNGYVATYDEETGAYTYGTETAYGTATTYGTYATLFSVKESVTFTLTSTSGGGTVYNTNAKANTWYYNDEIVKREILYKSVSYVVSSGGSNFTVNINGGINFHATALYYSTSGAHNYTTINIDNVNFYYKAPDDDPSESTDVYYAKIFPINAKNGENMTVSNSLFYTPVGASMIRCYNASAVTCSYKFINCDFIKANTSYRLDVETKKAATEIVFDNCRLYDTGHSSVAATSINGTYATNNDASAIPAGSGFENKVLSTSVSFSYLVPKVTAFAIADSNALIQEISLDYPCTETVTAYFNVVAAKTVTVNWMNGEEVYKTTEVVIYPGSDIEIPKLTKELEGDLYRDILYQWVDANNNLAVNVLSSNIDWEIDTYTFNAAESLDGVTKYVPVLKDAQLSLSYVSQFHQLFYLPVVEGMERPTITGYKPDALGTVIINRQQYYLYTYWESATTIFNTHTLEVNYTIDGVDYTAKVDVSALIYADLILSNQDYYAAEAESVANMVRYAYECYKITSSDATVAANLEKYTPKITELIGTVAADGSSTGGKFNLNAYTTSFGEVAESDIENYGQYIHSMGFGIVGTSGRTMVILNKEATDAGVTIYFNGSKGRTDTTTIKNENDEDVTVTVFFVDNQKVYNAIGKINITIKVSEEESYSTSYSLPQYITEVSKQSPEANINVAKAMYDFGVAAKAYVEGLSDY